MNCEETLNATKINTDDIKTSSDTLILSTDSIKNKLIDISIYQNDGTSILLSLPEALEMISAYGQLNNALLNSLQSNGVDFSPLETKIDNIETNMQKILDFLGVQ